MYVFPGLGTSPQFEAGILGGGADPRPAEGLRRAEATDPGPARPERGALQQDRPGAGPLRAAARLHAAAGERPGKDERQVERPEGEGELVSFFFGMLHPNGL